MTDFERKRTEATLQTSSRKRYYIISAHWMDRTIGTPCCSVMCSKVSSNTNYIFRETTFLFSPPQAERLQTNISTHPQIKQFA